ncbi:MAG: 30S ribosomal protein S1 [Deltaproteobacteria bacterium]|nr:30S ribosomal protein S1 [Deltaproteobacteria bacterium]
MTNESVEETGEEGAEDFARLLAESPMEKDWFRPGQKVEALIVKITPDWIFLDLGGKSEGYLDRRELQDAEGNLSVREGETIKAYFLSTRQNEKLFTTKIGSGEAGRAYLEDAWRERIPVEGLIEKEVKGGFEVRIAGTVRGFCPYSQMGLGRLENSGDLIGKHVTFLVTEFGGRGRNIILSHRAILEEELRQKREELKASLQEGMVVRGKVASIQKFGAFVDIGGFQGLLPISEMGWGRVEDIHEVLAVGQELDVAVVKLDWAQDRVTLSLKETQPDPWDRVETDYPEGSVHTGKVVRLTKFGAFLNLGNGVDGLIHISRLGAGKRIGHPSEVVSLGQSLAVRIEKVDKGARRISLLPAGAEQEGTEKAEEDDYKRFVGKNAGSLGSLGDILSDKLPSKGRGGGKA